MNIDYLIGQKVGVSTLLRERARGSRAVIFDAYQMGLKRRVAVKILPRMLLTPLTAELIYQEAEAAAILSHPNIATIHEVGETEDFFFVASLLIEQGESAQYIQNQMGHSSINVTFDIYGHLMKDSDQEAANRLGNTIFGESGSKSVAFQEERT
jgi:integrase